MSMRLFAMVETSEIEKPTIHFRGLPEGIGGDESDREAYPYPSILIIRVGNSGVYLVRYAADGSDVGDTWHLNIEDAQHQAQVEYGEALGEWHAVPPEVNDPAEFARKHSRQ